MPAVSCSSLASSSIRRVRSGSIGEARCPQQAEKGEKPTPGPRIHDSLAGAAGPTADDDYEQPHIVPCPAHTTASERLIHRRLPDDLKRYAAYLMDLPCRAVAELAFNWLLSPKSPGRRIDCPGRDPYTQGERLVSNTIQPQQHRRLQWLLHLVFSSAPVLFLVSRGPTMSVDHVWKICPRANCRGCYLMYPDQDSQPLPPSRRNPQQILLHRPVRF